MSFGRPATHNRRNQPVIRFRVSEETKKQLIQACKNEGKSQQEFLEEMLKDKILKILVEKTT